MSSQPQKSSGEIRSNFSHLGPLDAQLVRLGALGAELSFPSQPDEIAANLTSASPLVLDGITARIAVAPEGTSNRTSTVLTLF